MKKSKTILKITSIVILILSICCVLVALSSLFFGVTTATSSSTENSVSITQQTIESTQTSSELPITIANNYLGITMLVFAVIGAAILVLLTRMNFSSMVSDLGLSPFTAIYTIIAGALAISAMVLPGISGSTLLMSFGLYVPALATIKQMMSGDFHNVWLILLLLAGVIVGVFLSLGGIKKMLEQHRSAAMYAILGMMVASLYAIVMGPRTLEDPMPAMSVETFHVVWFIAGCAAVLGINLFKHWIDRKGRKAE